MQHISYAAEQSATQQGFVGQVKDAATDATLLRTAIAYPTAHEAITAARNLWAVRAVRIRNAARVSA